MIDDDTHGIASFAACFQTQKEGERLSCCEICNQFEIVFNSNSISDTLYFVLGVGEFRVSLLLCDFGVVLLLRSRCNTVCLDCFEHMFHGEPLFSLNLIQTRKSKMTTQQFCEFIVE